MFILFGEQYKHFLKIERMVKAMVPDGSHPQNIDYPKPGFHQANLCFAF